MVCLKFGWQWFSWKLRPRLIELATLGTWINFCPHLKIFAWLEWHWVWNFAHIVVVNLRVSGKSKQKFCTSIMGISNVTRMHVRHIKPRDILEPYNALVSCSGGRHWQSSGYVILVCFPRELGISVRSERFIRLWGTPVLRWSTAVWCFFCVNFSWVKNVQ
jgi:hypothetical protein